jgi:hypothetical protein
MREEWRQDVIIRLLCLLALDRFTDFGYGFVLIYEDGTCLICVDYCVVP